MQQKPKIAFFGGEPLGLPALQALVKADLIPSLVLCNPDRPSGRGQQLRTSPLKAWAEQQHLEIFQPTSYKVREDLTPITNTDWDLFVVVAYNFILPKWLLELPKRGVINVHPSLLPKLRGASPIRTAILENLKDEVGVSIMLMDEKMDHGPILAQEAMVIPDSEWPMNGPTFDALLAAKGGDMLAATIPQWLNGSLTPVEQEHVAATYTKKFEKAESELSIDPTNLPQGDEAFKMLCKIRAFAGMSDTFFMDFGKRIKIKEAIVSHDGSLQLLRVIPEGKKEMDFATYLTSRNDSTSL
jgi:methionyl-tRNA formyltransferase